MDASHLFESSTTKTGIRRGTFLRSYMYDFMNMFAPHLERELVQKAVETNSQEELDQLFQHIELPRH